MRHRVLPVGILFAFAVSGCASSSNLEAYRPKDQDEAQIVSMLLRIPEGIKSRSLNLIMLPYAEDVHVGNFQKYLGVASPTAPLSLSRADLRTAYFELFRSVKDISMDVKDFRLTRSGDHAVAEARTELLLKLEGGRKERKEQVFVNDVTWRLRRTPGGWKIVEETWR
ncbi:MAG: nuclear transport factor 2 family protein [candidate division NC10 bacterium]